MTHSASKRRVSYGVVLVGALGIAVGCAKDGGIGPAADYSLSLTPAALTLIQGANAPTTVTISRTNFTGAVTLSLGNAPAGVTGSFDPAAPTGTSSTVMVGVGATAAPGVYNLRVDGTGSAGNRSTPFALTVTSSGGRAGALATVSAAYGYSCALDASGQAYCWGIGAELGAPTTETCTTQSSNYPCSTRPLAVSGGLTLAALTAAWSHTCALNTSGAAYCWGSNFGGQLGDGTIANRLVPTPVAGGLTFAALSAGYTHTCGVATSGAGYCWGGESGHIYGQLGDGTTTQRLVPTGVVGGLSFAAVSTGSWHTCGVTTSGAAYCWGENLFGELGDGTTTQRLVPTAVAFP